MNEYIPHATQPSGIVQDILGFVNEKPKLLLFWIGFIQALYIIFVFAWKYFYSSKGNIKLSIFK